MGYTKKEIIDKLEKISEISQIYTNKIINYKGTTKDTKEKYTEVIAQEIVNHAKKYNFDNIKQINRTLGYKIDTHEGIFNNQSNRREEIIAMKMYQNTYLEIGKMLDYQIPLKDKKETTAGKIDLISYEEKQNRLYLVELKNDFSKESLLRCILEIITYSKQIDVNKLKKDFDLKENVEVKPAILIFERNKTL